VEEALQSLIGWGVSLLLKDRLADALAGFSIKPDARVATSVVGPFFTKKLTDESDLL